MDKSWTQKQVDIAHWLQDIQPESPDPTKVSDRELTFSSDIFTTDQASLSQPLTRPISSHPHSNLPDNTVLEHKPSPVLESAACISTQPSLTSSPQLYFVPNKLQSPKNLVYESTTSPPKDGPKVPKSLQGKSHSPLPPATPEPKLPIFTFDDNGDASEENSDQANLKVVNMRVNRPPNNPMKYFSRSSTFPNNTTNHSSLNLYKGSSPVTFNTTGFPLRPFNIHSLRVNSDLLNSRRKSLSQDDISQFVEKERQPTKERHSSDSELNQNDSEEYTLVLERDSQSSIKACGFGSDLSGSSSTHRDASNEESPVTLKRKQFGVLSAGSVDVLATRLRERMMVTRAHSSDEEDVSLAPPAHLSPASPTLSHQSCLSHSPLPTPPASPYHTPIIPLNVRSETSHPIPLRPVGKSENGISKSRLRQFNISQQFSFDTTNDEEFSAPSRHPKFLKNNVSMLSKSHYMTHSRSHSDVSSIPFPSYSHTRSSSSLQESRGLPIKHNSENKDKAMCQYMSQLELSTQRQIPNTEGSKTLTLFEQLQLRRAQTVGKTSGDSVKSKLFRQDSGLGTLSTVSQRL